MTSGFQAVLTTNESVIAIKTKQYTIKEHEECSRELLREKTLL
jgi:hypothetical protein